MASNSPPVVTAPATISHLDTHECTRISPVPGTVMLSSMHKHRLLYTHVILHSIPNPLSQRTSIQLTSSNQLFV